MENKIVAVVGAIVVIILNRLVGEFGGVELLDSETILALAGVVGTYLVGQGISERGK